MPDLLDILPKQKQSIKIENGVERKINIIKESVLVRDVAMMLSGDMFPCADIFLS